MISIRRWWLGRTEVIVPWAVQAVAVVLTAIYAATRGWAYLPHNRPEDVPDAITKLTTWSGLTPWAVAWCVAAVLCGVGFVRRRPRWCLGVAVLAGLWGFGYGITGVREWLEVPGSSDRSYLTAWSYLFPAGLITLWVIAAKRPDRGGSDDRGA